MLKPSFLAKVADKVVELFEMLNIFAVRDMARRIADAGNHMTASADYQAYLLVQSGELLEDIEDEIADVLGESDEVVRQIFEESTLVSQTNDRTAAGETATAEAAPAGTAAEPSSAGATAAEAPTATAEPAAPQEATPEQAAEDARAAQEAAHAAEQAQATEAERQAQAVEAAQAAQEQTAQEAAQAEVPQLSEQALKDMQVLYEQTNGELENFTQTTAEEAQKDFIEACSDAMAKVRSGLESPEQAIREAIEKAARQGLHVTYPSGHVDTVEVAVRRAVMTGVNQASLRMTIDECDRMGTNFVVVSSHLGARVSDIDPHANHAGWQGGVYRIANRLNDFYGPLEHLNEEYGGGEYEYLEDATGYPSDPLGLGGYNCRHSMYPYVPGVSENHMQEFDETENRRAYELSQEQRAMERAMRAERRQIEALKEAYSTTPTDELKTALAEHRAVYKDMRQEYEDFCAENGLTPQLNRTYTAS